MAVFNTAAYLPDAILSIQAQSWKDFELIIIDDGSTDGSGEILAGFAANDARILVIARENRGLIETRNELLSLARADLVAWMDSDDVSLPERLSRQVEMFRSDPALICVGVAVQCIDPQGQALRVERYPTSHAEILLQQQLGGAMRFPSTMMKRTVALAVGSFREPFRIGEDFDLLLRMSEVGKMANLESMLYLYRQHLSSTCTIQGPIWIEYRDVILSLARERLETGTDRLQRGERLKVSPVASSPSKASKGRVYAGWSTEAMQNGNRPLALKYAWAAVQTKPTAYASWKTLSIALLAGRS